MSDCGADIEGRFSEGTGTAQLQLHVWLRGSARGSSENREEHNAQAVIKAVFDLRKCLDRKCTELGRKRSLPPKTFFTCIFSRCHVSFFLKQLRARSKKKLAKI